MDLEKIRKAREAEKLKQAQAAKEAQQSQADSLNTSRLERQIVVQAEKSRKSTQKVEVVNQPKLEIEHTTDFKPLENKLDEVIKHLDKLPDGIKIPAQEKTESVAVTNLIDYGKELKEILGAVKAIKLDPQVNVAAPSVTIPKTEIDTTGIIKKLDDVLSQLKKTPAQLDLTPLEVATKSVKDAINGLSFPVPNYVLPFSKDGKATQVVLNSDGSLPITASISTGSLATASNQTSGAQLTQIVDAGGEVATVTGGKLDVNATASLAGSALPIASATTGVGVAILDSSGNQISTFGGGTEYTEDAPSAANPVGGMLISRRKDTLSTSEVSADGDNIALNATNKGQLHVKLADTVAVDGSGVTQPVSATNLDVALSTRLKPADTLTKVATVDTITNVVHVDDNAGSLTVDGTVAVSGTVTVDSELTTADLDTGAGTDTRAVVGLVGSKSGGGVLIPGDATKGLAVDLTNTGANATALKVDGSAVTQPVSLATNTPTLQSGSTTAVTQATAANLNATVVNAAGSALMGKVGIDQTTPGTTNAVALNTTNVVSTANSSTATLAANGVFTGTSEDITNYASATILVISDVASATDGLSIQQSSNGTNWDNLDLYTIPAATGKSFAVQATAKFFRIVYTNGGTIQTSFRLQTIFHTIAGPTSSTRPQDARTNDNDMQESLAYLMGYNGTTFDRIRTKGTGVLSSDITTINNVTPLMGNGVTGTGSQRVTIASDNTAFSVNATLSAETTKVLGVTRTADGAGNLLTSNSTTPTAKFALDSNITSILGTAPTTVGKLDVKGADGDVFVRQATASNLNATVVNAAGSALMGKVGLDQTTPGTTNAVSISQIGATTVGTGNGVSGAGVQRVTIASDSTGQVAPAANATAIGASISYTAALVATKVAVNASAGNLYGYHIYNPNTVVIYVQLFNVASASVTVGTTAPTSVIVVPAGGWADSSYPVPITFGTALTVAATTTASGLTAPSTGLVANFWYK